jgi:hypothetical protein
MGNTIARYRIFRGTMTTWDALFGEAAAFATTLGPTRVISISHSEDRSDGVVVVWFWNTESDPEAFEVHDDTEAQS